jgi:RHS repeat-associated protein
MKKSGKCVFSLLFVLTTTLVIVTDAAAEMRHSAKFAPPSVTPASAVGASRTLLPDGRILIAGGQDSSGKVEASLSTLDPLTGEITVLDTELRYPRAGHTATVLTDGTVLVLGGIGDDGRLVGSAEIFDPVTGSVRLVPTQPPTARAFHTATLLTDGHVLIVGGVLDSGGSARTIELWDPRAERNTTLLPRVTMDRRNHTANLLPDGRVLFSGGIDQHDSTSSSTQVYDPQSQTISAIASTKSFAEASSALTEMRASSPQDGAQNVQLDTLISIRFSRPVQMASISSTTVTLEGPNGIISAKTIAAEGGMLAFLTPVSELAPASSYTVKIAGAVDIGNQSVAYAEFSFSTAGGVPGGSEGDEHWTPTSDWRTHRGQSKYELLTDLQGPRGTTSLAGQVLKLNGEPLPHVTLEMGNRRTESDSTGRFLLTDIPSGHQILVIEGATANTPGKSYGRYEFGDEIKAGVTNKLDFKIWMSLLDMMHEVTIPSPTAKETTITTPTMPGLELRLPAGTVITDASGKIVRKITITPIPVDRPPFPLPFVVVPTYFTIQPGGAYISVSGNGPRGARLFYPNTEHKGPGVPYAFWNYNADRNGWSVYGQGRVNQQGNQVVPDPRVVIYDFSGAMVGSGSAGPNTQGTPGDNSSDGEPVQLSSGLFVYNKTDLVLPDVIPISLTRTYRPNDSWSRPFGIGATHPYEMFIGGDGNGFGITKYIDLVLPDGTRIHYVGNGPGPSYTSYLHSAAGTPWYDSTISSAPINPNGYVLPGAWHLQTKDGTIYSFLSSDGLINPGCQALVGITDRYGNQLKITRNGDANCTIAQITSPSGRYLQFQYDSSYRVKVATDNIGRQVLYNYDASGRLWTVTDANSGTWTYGYDTQNRMTTIQDPKLITYLTNVYDSSGRVHYQYLADGTSYYQFNWTPTSNTQNVTFTASSGSGGPSSYQVLGFRSCSSCSESFQPLIAQVDVIDPRGYTRRVIFNQYGYTSSDTHAYGQTEQETATYTYSPDNLIASVTDQLGRVTTYNYDVNANPTSITRLSGTSNAVTLTAEYDSLFSKPLTATDPLGNTTTYSYDTYGNLTTLTDPLGHQMTFGYNGIGQVTSATDALQHTTQFTYDFADLTGITDPMQNTTSMFYDTVGRVVTRTDPLGNTVKYQYNPLDRITQITDALQGITTFNYDPNGNLQSVLDARQQGTNNKTTYTYDNFDHLLMRTDPLNRQESYVFDQLGNLTKYTDRRGKVTTFQFDGINRRTFVGYGTLPGPTYESTVSYTYDGGNRLQSLVDSSSGTITPVFDGLNRLTSETTPTGSVNYTYDNGGRRLSTTVSGQTSNCYSYDNANRLVGIGQGTCPVGTYTTSFTYDNANRRSTMTLSNGIVLTYGYDNDSRINSLSYQLGTTQIGALTYQYDGAGRRIQVGGSLASTGFPAAVSSAVYDVNNELTNWNGTTISFDNNGNIQNDGSATYTWNARNQLISRGSTSFQYDPFGRRTLNAAGKNLFYDGFDVVQELSGTTPTANKVIGATDEFFSRTDSTGAYTPITDALGSVLSLANSSGTIVTQYSYDPFGGTSSSGSANSNSSQYTGRENDGNGLYYYRARYYSPGLHRFVSQDPLGFTGGAANLYAYAGNSPTNLRDPNGQSPCVVGAAAGVIIYNGYQIWREVSAFMNGRKVPNAGWSGAWSIISGSAQAAATGCAIADGVTGLAGAGEGAAEAGVTCCFRAGTPVRTRRGLVPIEKIRIGDEVLTRNETTEKLEYKKVVRLTEPHKDKLLQLQIAGEPLPLSPTEDHQLFVKSPSGTGAWIAASRLNVGDAILTRKGTWTKVTAISRLEREETVYNFEVEGNHDYFVGAVGILVHNDLCEIAARYPLESGRCVECAIEMQNAIAETGAESQPIFVTNPDGPIYYGDNGPLISATEDGGYHVGVESNGLVYDAANPGGVPVNEWGPFTDGAGNPLTPGTTPLFP